MFLIKLPTNNHKIFHIWWIHLYFNKFVLLFSRILAFLQKYYDFPFIFKCLVAIFKTLKFTQNISTFFYLNLKSFLEFEAFLEKYYDFPFIFKCVVTIFKTLEFIENISTSFYLNWKSSLELKIFLKIMIFPLFLNI